MKNKTKEGRGRVRSGCVCVRVCVWSAEAKEWQGRLGESRQSEAQKAMRKRKGKEGEEKTKSGRKSRGGEKSGTEERRR